MHAMNFPCTYSFLSYYPLKQGLKLDTENYSASRYAIFILLSIKTRIETGPAGAGKTASAHFYPTIH